MTLSDFQYLETKWEATMFDPGGIHLLGNENLIQV